MTLNEIKECLSRVDKELEELAAIVKQMIPESPTRDDPTWEAFNCLGGAGSAATRARRALDRAIKEL